MCTEETKHCILESKMLMKTLRNACMEQEADLSEAPSTNGEPER